MKALLLRNWHLKLISLALATILWAEVGRVPTSEIGLSVALEYQNIPAQTEVFGDTTDRVEVRLRGPSSVVRTLTAQDLSLSIDVKGMSMEQQKILALTPELVRAPFGVEVVRVEPAWVRLTVEPTAKKSVKIVPSLNGQPSPGFEVGKSSVTPASIQVEGPASRVSRIETMTTAEVDLTGHQSTFTENVELNIEDPLLRIPALVPVTVQVEIRPETK
jgi:YbbR domain-containing protein